MFDPFIVLDLETTGVDVTTDVPVQSYVGVFSSEDMSRPLAEQELIWNTPPHLQDNADEAAKIHGITPRLSSLGVSQESGIAALSDFIRRIQLDYTDGKDYGLPIVAYNAAFDLSMLYAVAKRSLNVRILPFFERQLVLDPFVLDKQLDKWRKGKRTLSAVARHYGCASEEQLENAHDARMDCRITANLLVEIVEKYRLYKDPLPRLHRIQSVWAEEQLVSLAKFKGFSPVETSGWPIQNRLLAVE